MGKNRKREKECDEGTLSEKSISKQSVNVGQDRTTTTSSTLTEHGSTQLLNNSQKDGHLTDFETVTFIPDNSKRNGQITDLDTVNLSCNSKGNSMLTMPDTVNSTNGQITGLETVHKCISDIEANNNPVLQRHCNTLEINGHQCLDRGDVTPSRQHYTFTQHVEPVCQSDVEYEERRFPLPASLPPRRSMNFSPSRNYVPVHDGIMSQRDRNQNDTNEATKVKDVLQTMSQILETMNDKISNGTHIRSMPQRKQKTKSVPRLLKRSKSSYSDSDDTSSSSGDSSDNISDSNDDSVSTRIVTDKRTKRYTCKLPPFTGEGKEKWSVWKSRFETVASRSRWSDEEKLDELLPKLHGEAGEFVFDQLKHKTRSNYRKLVDELDSRYRIVETKKSLEAKFSNRKQRPNESVETYATELKKLYAKAYPDRDDKTKREDLLRRFFDGLTDEKVQSQVEFVKDSDNIDDAVFEVVNFQDMNKRNSNKQEKKMTRAITEAPQNNFKNNHRNKETSTGSQQKPKVNNKSPSYSSTENQLQDEMNILRQQMSEIQKSIEQLSQRNPPFKNTKSSMSCYHCGKLGHFKQDCPMLHFQPHVAPPVSQHYNGSSRSNSYSAAPLNIQGS